MRRDVPLGTGARLAVPRGAADGLPGGPVPRCRNARHAAGRATRCGRPAGGPPPAAGPASCCAPADGPHDRCGHRARARPAGVGPARRGGRPAPGRPADAGPASPVDRSPAGRPADAAPASSPAPHRRRSPTRAAGGGPATPCGARRRAGRRRAAAAGPATRCEAHRNSRRRQAAAAGPASPDGRPVHGRPADGGPASQNGPRGDGRPADGGPATPCGAHRHSRRRRAADGDPASPDLDVRHHRLDRQHHPGDDAAAARRQDDAPATRCRGCPRTGRRQDAVPARNPDRHDPRRRRAGRPPAPADGPARSRCGPLGVPVRRYRRRLVAEKSCASAYLRVGCSTRSAAGGDRERQKRGSERVALTPRSWNDLSGGVLLSHPVSGAVPSALRGLASGFGMDPGVSLSPWPP